MPESKKRRRSPSLDRGLGDGGCEPKPFKPLGLPKPFKPLGSSEPLDFKSFRPLGQVHRAVEEVTVEACVDAVNVQPLSYASFPRHMKLHPSVIAELLGGDRQMSFHIPTTGMDPAARLGLLRSVAKVSHCASLRFPLEGIDERTADAIRADENLNPDSGARLSMIPLSAYPLEKWLEIVGLETDYDDVRDDALSDVQAHVLAQVAPALVRAHPEQLERVGNVCRFQLSEFFPDLVPIVETTWRIACDAAVRRDGMQLKHVPSDLLTTGMCVAAVTQNPAAIEFVPPSMITPQLRAIVPPPQPGRPAE